MRGNRQKNKRQRQAALPFETIKERVLPAVPGAIPHSASASIPRSTSHAIPRAVILIPAARRVQAFLLFRGKASLRLIGRHIESRAPVRIARRAIPACAGAIPAITPAGTSSPSLGHGNPNRCEQGNCHNGEDYLSHCFSPLFSIFPFAFALLYQQPSCHIGAL